MESGLKIVVDGDHAVTVGLVAINQPEIQMRISPADDAAEIKAILLRISTYIVSCHSRLQEGDTLDLGEYKVELQNHYSGRLEIKRLIGR